MEGKKTLWERVKDTFNTPINPAPSFAPAPADPAVPAPPGSTSTNGTATFPLADGTTLSIMYSDPSATAPSVGDAVLLDGQPAPAGDYMLPDGSGITVGPDATISALIAAGSAVDPATVDPGDQGAVDAGSEARFADYDQRLTAMQDQLNQIMEKLGKFESVKFAKEDIMTETRNGLELLSDQFEQFLKTPSADPATVTEKETRAMSYKEKRDEKLKTFAEAIKKKGKVQA